MYKRVSIAIAVLLLFLISGCKRSGKMIVKFYSDEALYQTIEVERGEAVNMPLRPQLDNYVFIGWFIDKEMTTLFAEETLIYENISLYGTYEKKLTHKHSQIEKVVEATCTEKGSKYVSCNTCKEIISTEEYEALWHTHSEDAIIKETVSATCTSFGYDLYECSRCHMDYQENIVSATGHLGELLSEDKASCLYSGTKYYKCTICNENYSEKVEPTGHVYEGTNPCSYCGMEFYTAGLTFALNSSGSGYVVTGYDAKTKQVYIPSIYNDLPVVGIADSAFLKKTVISSISIPSTITYIGNNAFLGCTTLGEINLAAASALKTIGSFAFKNCNTVTSVTFNENIEVIGQGAFAGCVNIKKIDLSNTKLIEIKEEAFSECILLKEVYLNKELKKLGASAFKQCLDLESIDLSSLTALTSIADFTFANCSSLTSIALPSSVINLGQQSFYKCDELTTIVLPKNLEVIGVQAFNGCKKLAIVDFSKCEKNLAIKTKAFYDCSSLESILIPSTLTQISSEAFSGCTNLKTVYIDSSIIAQEITSKTGLIQYATNVYINKKIGLNTYFLGIGYTDEYVDLVLYSKISY